MHVLRVVQVRDGEVKGECQQGRASDFSEIEREDVMSQVTSRARFRGQRW